MSAHDHRTHVPGCFRCDLSRDETEDAMRTPTDRAVAEAHEGARRHGYAIGSPAEGAYLWGWADSTEWAASLPPTWDEQIAAARALWMEFHADEDPEWAAQAWDDMGGSEPTSERSGYEIAARAALTAAREAQ